MLCGFEGMLSVRVRVPNVSRGLILKYRVRIESYPLVAPCSVQSDFGWGDGVHSFFVVFPSAYIKSQTPLVGILSHYRAGWIVVFRVLGSMLSRYHQLDHG